MGRIKVCANEPCEAYKKKNAYKDSEVFCSKCGSPLVYVCKDCYTQLPNDTDKYCVRCLAKQDDRKDTAKKIVGVGFGVIAVASVILDCGTKVYDEVKKTKG